MVGEDISSDAGSGAGSGEVRLRPTAIGHWRSRAPVPPQSHLPTPLASPVNDADCGIGISPPTTFLPVCNSEKVSGATIGAVAENWAAPARRAGAEQEHGADDGADHASLHKFWHRAGWLVLLLMCQSTSSVILERFEVLIRTHPVVIYFLTMLVGAGGNAGSQSTVLVVRRLALAAVHGGRSQERFSVRRIVGSEVSVGARLALVLFVGTFVRCVVFQVRGSECLAICLSMLVIVFTSTLAGAALPLLLRRLEVDPAHAGATIQVVMDISGVTLTCIVSSLVLGLPLSAEQASAGVNATQGHEARSFGPRMGNLAGPSHGLQAFGSAATSVPPLPGVGGGAAVVRGQAVPAPGT